MLNLHFRVFENPGPNNTRATLECALENAKELKLKYIIIASTTGETIQQALNLFNPNEFSLICVTHNYWFKEDTPQTFPEDLRKDLQIKGVRIVTGTLAFSGIGSALLRKYNQMDPLTTFSRLLRTTICDGLKVALEITVMAVDAGAIPANEECIAIAGSGRGADTCCWIKTTSSRFFENLRVKSILTKPM